MKNNLLFKTLLFASLILLSINSKIISQTAAPADSSKLSITGSVDVNYNYNFNTPASMVNGYRNFDVKENQFNINLAKITLQKNASPVGFRIDVGYGQAMDLVNSNGNLGSQLSLRNIEQAYITAVVPIGTGLTINAGKMSTHMGGEVIESATNINYSRSLLFTLAIPYDHLGVCANYAFSPQFNATVYVYNGWNNVDENNTDKTLGAEISWSPSSIFTFIENYIGGAEETKSTSQRHVFDTIINLQATDALFLTVNADYGQESLNGGGLAVWKGVALTGKYAISDKTTIAARGEYYNDQSGFTSGTVQALKEVTLTYEYKFTNSLLTRIEYRGDFSSQNTFEDSNGVYSNNNQNTILVGAIYSF
jgi:hypothetical protein